MPNQLRRANELMSACLRRASIVFGLLTAVALTAPADAQGQTTLFYDSFTGADGTSLADHAPDLNPAGGGWALTGAVSAVLTNQRAGATAQNSANFIEEATIDVAWSEGIVGVDWTPAAASRTTS